MPGPHSSFFMAYMHLTQDQWVWFYSGIALGEEICFGTPILWGASCVRTPSSPLLRKTCTLSVSVDIKFHCTFWSGDHGSCDYLVLLQGFAITRAWYYVLRDTTKPTYHSMNPWHQVVLSWPNASLSSKAWCCNFVSSIAQEHLPWSIFHVALPLFFLWANRNTSEPLTYSVLHYLGHTGKCVHDICIWCLWSCQSDENAWYLCFTRTWFDDEFFL